MLNVNISRLQHSLPMKLIHLAHSLQMHCSASPKATNKENKNVMCKCRTEKNTLAEKEIVCMYKWVGICLNSSYKRVNTVLLILLRFKVWILTTNKYISPFKWITNIKCILSCPTTKNRTLARERKREKGKGKRKKLGQLKKKPNSNEQRKRMAKNCSNFKKIFVVVCVCYLAFYITNKLYVRVWIWLGFRGCLNHIFIVIFIGQFNMP